MKRLICMAAIAAMTVGVAAAVHSQVFDPSAMAKQVRQNQEDLQQYSWQTKMTFLVNGELRRTDTYTVRYVMGGMVEKMQVSSEVAEGKVRGPNGKKLSKKELEAAREFVLGVKDQLDGYLNPLFAERAVATSTIEESGGNLLLRSRDVMTTGDSVEITLSGATYKPISASVKTSVQGSPVALDVTFGSIEFGPNYPKGSTTTSEWQGFKLSFITENSSYELSGI